MSYASVARWRLGSVVGMAFGSTSSGQQLYSMASYICPASYGSAEDWHSTGSLYT